MILLVHKDEKVTKITDLESNELLKISDENPINALFNIASEYKNRILIWCHETLQPNLNFEEIKSAFYLNNLMLSYSVYQYFPEQIGYVEDSLFLKINKKVKYPTWLVSSFVGAIYASQLLKFNIKLYKNDTFNFALNSIAKLGISKGLLCYSEPRLLRSFNSIKKESASTLELFKFVKLHYKSVWSLLLLINFIINEHKFPFTSFLRTIFLRKTNPALEFDFELLSTEFTYRNSTIDIIVPTLGRKEHIYNFMKDLANQKHLPNQVIIVEQNENKDSISDLDFISKETWPFKIIHKFIYKTGACNARNIGLSLIASDYVFFADDDIRISSDFITSTLQTMKSYKLQAVTLSCLGKNDIKKLDKPIQWTAFGSGCSVVETKKLKDIKFDMRYEFGYGEDVDFGMQLRNNGTDIIYLPYPEIIHLKAPIGGFRTKFIHAWQTDKILPKPAPTVMLNRKLNSTKCQLLGYRTTLFLKFYKQQKIKNPFKYFSRFKKQWLVSETWANRLNKPL